TFSFVVKMRLCSSIITGALLLCGLSRALPGTFVKRTFKIDTDKCPRSQDDKDLIETEFGIAKDMAGAVADFDLTSDNKWTKYFFDDETIKDPKPITSYYGNLRNTWSDPSFKVAITCPTKEGDADWDVCGKDEWASSQSAGNLRVTLCPLFFSDIDGYVKEDSSVVASNCKPGAKGEKNWKIIEQFKGNKDSEDLPPAESKQARDYAYDRSSCKKLRDGKQQNIDLCSSYDKKICPAEKSFRNADSIAFVAAGIYWEDKCGKTIDIEVESGDPDEVNDPGSDTEDPDGSGGGTTTSSAGSSNQTPPPDNPPDDPPPPPESTSTTEEPPEETPPPPPPPAPCKSGMYSESSCNDSCGDGECKSGSTALGQLYYICDCP
ncbi:MAG: hypothetical protein Q9169_008315, partial [Polycauliona sp. 2 TL-2023]